MPDGNELRGGQQPQPSSPRLRKRGSRHEKKKETSTPDDGKRRSSIKVADLLPTKFQDLWKQSGITLDKMTTATSGNLLYDLNHLRVPLEDDASQSDFEDFLEDAQLLEEIRKDVARTLPHLLFFLEPKQDLGLRRYAALERILFLWAKLNKGVSTRRIFAMSFNANSKPRRSHLLLHSPTARFVMFRE